MIYAFLIACLWSVVGNFFDWRTTSLDLKASKATEADPVGAWLMRDHIWDAFKLGFVMAVDLAVWRFGYTIDPVACIWSVAVIGAFFAIAAWSNWRIFNGKPGILALI